MIAIVQRVSRAKVTVGEEIVGEIGSGMTVLTAVEVGDTDADVDWMAAKLTGLRIIQNGEKHFDQDVKQAGGAILLVSNFTVAVETAKVAASLNNAAPAEVGRVMFQKLVEAVKKQGVPVETGRFGAAMLVEIVNDGPATFVVQSREKMNNSPSQNDSSLR